MSLSLIYLWKLFAELYDANLLSPPILPLSLANVAINQMLGLGKAYRNGPLDSFWTSFFLVHHEDI